MLIDPIDVLESSFLFQANMFIENVFILFLHCFFHEYIGNFANGGNFLVLSTIGKQCMKLFGIVLVRFETISR
jgi:hypothetical protein